MKQILLLFSLLFLHSAVARGENDDNNADALKSSYPEERVFTINDKYPDVFLTVNAPAVLDKNKKTKIIIYALPNGNTIEWTAGKKTGKEDDWHFDIQHIAAQTRFLRVKTLPEYNYITVYAMASKKSWSSWRTDHADVASTVLPAIINDLVDMYKQYKPSVILSSHSGGGYFIFEYIKRVKKISPLVERIVFLDSTYGYSEEEHKDKLEAWLKGSKQHFLNVTSYQDSTVIYNGKPLVSPHGGTWWRSKKMQQDLSKKLSFVKHETDALLLFSHNNGQVQFKLIKNPEGLIWHTVLVEKNGFIDSVLTGTAACGIGYSFWGDRAYSGFIENAPMQ